MLDKIELFAGLNSKELKDLEGIAKFSTYTRGETIFAQGDFSSELYIIESGQVEVSIKDILQNKRVLSIFKNGDFFGEMALFDKNTTRSATAKALMNSNLIAIPRKEFEVLLQSRPTISFKLLSALSKRLRDANLRAASPATAEKRQDAKVITIAAPQNGYGKTTLATTMAHLISAELEKRVLYLDLDLAFAEGTFVMGIYSPRSIVNLVQGLRGGPPNREDLFKHFVRVHDNLFVVPAPTNFLDGEVVKGQDIVSIIKTCRPHFDYIIIDTDSAVEEKLLNSFDLSDHMIFLVQTQEVLSLKSNVRYFHGLEKLNYPAERMSILIGKIGEKFDLEKTRKLFKFKVVGGLPVVAGYSHQYGRSLYHLDPTSNFTGVARMLLKSTFREEFPGNGEAAGRGFLYRLFFDKTEKSAEVLPSDVMRHLGTTEGGSLAISEAALTVLLKYIRTNLIYGNHEEARVQTIKLLEFCQNSSTLYQILGEIFMGENNIAEAIDAFKRAVELDPGNYLALGYLGDLSNDEACFDQAITILKARVEKSPNYPDLLNDLGKLSFKKGDLAKAEQMFKTALEKNSGYLEASINLAVVLGETQKFDEALATLEAIEPKNIRVFYLMGKFFHATGRFFEAMEAYSRVAQIKSNYHDVGEQLDHLQDYFQRLMTLISMHQELLSSHPTYPDLHLKMGNLYRMVGKRAEAEAEFKEALRLNPKYDIARKCLEDVKAAPVFALSTATAGILEKAQAAGSSEPIENFQIDLELELPVKGPRAVKILGQCLVRVRNIRTGRSLEKIIPPEVISGKSIQLDCSRLGTIALQDTLLVQLFDQTSGTILNALPHSVSEGEIHRKAARICISQLFESLFSEKTFAPPVRYFLVNFLSKNLAESISGHNPRYIANLVNMNSGAICQGQVSEENPSQINFVLLAAHDEDVVHIDDKLRFKIQDLKGNTIFSMDFAVNKADIENFSKAVAFEESEDEDGAHPWSADPLREMTAEQRLKVGR